VNHYATWTREAIICCLQDIAEEAGGIPPSAVGFQRMKRNGADVPAVTNVIARFGSWNAAVTAAGYEPHAAGPVGGFRILTAHERAECARRYATGESSVDIAAALGVSPVTVTKWARFHGVEIRPPFATRKAAA
jgi:hypothetical protein